ncbi:hypothetical protein [Streptomyces parvus]|nr:hypothetical protein [Streptomyces parvus]
MSEQVRQIAYVVCLAAIGSSIVAAVWSGRQPGAPLDSRHP